MAISSCYRKPVTVEEEKLAARCARGRVIVIDDEPEVLAALAVLLELEGYACETYLSALAYLNVLNYNSPSFPGPCCVLCDMKMPELDGLALQKRLALVDDIPMLLMSGSSGVFEAVTAFRAGAIDFLIKPFDADVLLDAVVKALSISSERNAQRVWRGEIQARVALLTERERDIARRVVSGQTNQAIADSLGIALRTVKLHRQHVMEKLGIHSLPELVRIADAVGF